MSSPDVRSVPYVYEPGKIKMLEDPYWPETGFLFPVSPAEIMDWATYIFEASDFLQLFED